MFLLLAAVACTPETDRSFGSMPDVDEGDSRAEPDFGEGEDLPACTRDRVGPEGGRLDEAGMSLAIAPGTFGVEVAISACRVPAPDAIPLSDGWEIRVEPPATVRVPLTIRLRGERDDDGAVFVPGPDGERVRAVDGGRVDGRWEARLHRAGLVSVGVDPRVMVPFEGQASTADLLFLVDNSCSMLDEQQKLANRLPIHLLDLLDATRVDYRLAVVPTDAAEPAQQGDLNHVGGLQWVESTTTDRDAMLADLLQVGNDGAQYGQAGLAAVSRTLSGVVGDAAGEGFPRPASSLAVVAVSHRDDEGPSSPSELAAQLLELSVDRPSVAFHSLVDTAGPDRGTRYIHTTQLVGGRVGDLVLADWDRFFEAVAFDLSSAAAMPLPTLEPPEVWWVFSDGTEPERVPDADVLWTGGALYGVRTPRPDAELRVLYTP